MSVDRTPRFDVPNYTVAAELQFPDRATGLPTPRRLPGLSEPDGQGRVEVPSDEPLIDVQHRRIRVLGNYWHAGWKHAVATTRLRVGVAERLIEVADALPAGWGLAVFDAWRPLELQIELYEAAVADPAIVEGFMAPPSTDPLRPPPHLSGGAVDVTLTYDGTPLGLGTGFDDTTTAAYAAALEDTPSVARDLRRFLFHAMAERDFVVYQGEWWHFEHGTCRWAALTDQPARYAATS